MKKVFIDSLTNASFLLKDLLENQNVIDRAVLLSKLLITSLQSNKKIYICGNGGSHCDALHFSEELTGRYKKNRRALGALALGEATHMTCVGNDFGFEFIFSRQIEGLGQPGDVLICISTSGKSINLYNAVKKAKEMHLKTAALLGRGGDKLKDLVDISIIVPGDTSERIQEIHIKLIHAIVESVERALFPDLY